jgi:hypothetical protein
VVRFAKIQIPRDVDCEANCKENRRRWRRQR